MVNEIEVLFPKLQGTNYRITSPKDHQYNCIAWAAGQTDQPWWPDLGCEDFWPEAAPSDESLTAFQTAFQSLGYDLCANQESEMGFEKIALFANGTGSPTHAARQLPGGNWSSKLGKMEDIEHALRDLEGETYGSVTLLMKRPIPATSAPKPNP